jgi:hypothetical protein
MTNNESTTPSEGESVPTLAVPPDFDEINGNWDEVRQYLAEQAVRGLIPDTLSKSIAANSLAAQIELFGGPVQIPETETNRGTSSAPVRGGTVARAFWWGFHIQFSHEDVQVIITALDGAALLINLLSQGDICPRPIRPFLPLVRIFLDVSRAVLQALDRGNGVYISMSWVAPGVFIPTSV